MRRRLVSIFMLLLGVFAAQAAFAAPQYLRFYVQFDESAPKYKKFDSYPTEKTPFPAESRNGWVIKEWWAGIAPTQVKEVQLQTGGETYEWDPNKLSKWDTLCEVFEPITYNLSFAAGGGSGSMQPNPMSGICYTNVFELPSCEFTRTGWAFSCWSNSVNGALFEDRATVSGEILCISNADKTATLTALWENLTFAVTLDRAGGSGGATSVNAIYGETLPKLTSLPTRAGYDFAGYFGAPEGAGDQYYDGKGEGLCVWPVKEPGTLYAKWEAKVGAMGYALEGGHFPSGSGQAAIVEWTYGRPFDVDTPEKDQFVFEGWQVTMGLDWKCCWYSTDDWATSNKVTTSIQEPCKPVDGKLSFINFNATGGEVHLTAVWSGQKTLTVKAVPEKGGSVTGGGSYDKGSQVGISATPNDGYSFIRWADDETAPAMRTVTVENDMTYTAVFTGNTYEVSFNAHGGQIDSESRTYRFGEPFGDLPQASRDGYSFSGWFSKSSGGKQYTEETWFDIDIINPEIAELTMHAQWALIPTYHVAYVGGPDATGEMDVQKICRDEETALTSNAFVRTGYTFLGWAETNDLWHVKYTDGTNVLNIAAADSTNELHAVWSANHYTVAFDGNGATEVAMDPRPFTYGKPQNLPPNTFVRGELWSFVGWSNEVDGTVFADGALVSNLCTTAGGTNTLRAVWRSNLTDLSRAMHCDNLIWISGQANNSWTANEGGASGYGLSGSDAQANATFIRGTFYTDYLVTTGTVGGTLSFYWKATSESATLNLYCDVDGEQAHDPVRFVHAGAVDDWQFVEWPVSLPSDASYQLMKLELQDKGPGESAVIRVNIDQMTWTPCGPQPGPENEVTISSVAVSEGKFMLSFASDERFDYNLLTNANLLIDSWGVMTNGVGTGGTIIFAPKIIEGQQQLFYKVETIQRK